MKKFLTIVMLMVLGLSLTSCGEKALSELSGAEITGISRVGQHLPTSPDGAPNIYVQQSQPSAPSTGDLWLW